MFYVLLFKVSITVEDGFVLERIIIDGEVGEYQPD
jgi:hypothetical protein